MIAILILAAGASSRMRGGDKLLEDVHGRTCLTHLVSEARATGHTVFAVVPDLDHPRANAATEATVVPAPDAGLGMAHSLAAGLAALPPTIGAAVILPGDMPEITRADIDAVIATHEATSKGIVQATTEAGTPGHPILFAASYFADMTKLSGDRGAWSVIETNRADWGTVPLEGSRARIDLDTPEDWAAWRAGRFKAEP